LHYSWTESAQTNVLVGLALEQVSVKKIMYGNRWNTRALGVRSARCDGELRIRERYVVQITPAFRCSGLWPRSAAHWPIPQILWPNPNLVAEVKAEGFDLLSKESVTLQGKQSSMEGDAWVLNFCEAENRLLQGGCRKKCLSILKTLKDRHLELPGNPVTSYHLKTLLLYECEKHPREIEWDETCLGDRINGILLQLISCLQCRRCPHYFLPQLDLFKGKSASSLENAAKHFESNFIFSGTSRFAYLVNLIDYSDHMIN
ncbi:Protein mab-21, partial [Araneus ventricosus]